MFSSAKTRVGLLALALMVLAAGGYLLVGGDNSKGGTNTATDPSGSASSFEDVPGGDEEPRVDPRTGETTDPFVIEFVKVLNAVNRFVAEGEFDTAMEIDDTYARLWRWGEAKGLRLRAVLNSRAIAAGNSEFQPQPAPFLDIQTDAGVKYCAADYRLLDESAAQDDTLRQAVVASSCQELLEDFYGSQPPAAATDLPAQQG